MPKAITEMTFEELMARLEQTQDLEEIEAIGDEVFRRDEMKIMTNEELADRLDRSSTPEEVEELGDEMMRRFHERSKEILQNWIIEAELLTE